MTMQTYTSTGRQSLRLWPGVIFAVVLVLGRYVLPLVVPDEIEIYSLPLGLIAIFAGMLSAVGIVVWWMFFSRAPWLERITAIVLMVAAVVVLKPLVHVSVRTGNMGYMLYFYAPPILALAVVVWAIVTRHLSAHPARLGAVRADPDGWCERHGRTASLAVDANSRGSAARRGARRAPESSARSRGSHAVESRS
jgi:hypothetical protein